MRSLNERLFTYPVNVLDIGCGTGVLTTGLGLKLNNVVGIEIDEESLIYFKELVLSKGARKVISILTDVCKEK